MGINSLPLSTDPAHSSLIAIAGDDASKPPHRGRVREGWLGEAGASGESTSLQQSEGERQVSTRDSTNFSLIELPDTRNLLTIEEAYELL